MFTTATYCMTAEGVCPTIRSNPAITRQDASFQPESPRFIAESRACHDRFLPGNPLGIRADGSCALHVQT